MKAILIVMVLIALGLFDALIIWACVKLEKEKDDE